MVCMPNLYPIRVVACRLGWSLLLILFIPYLRHTIATINSLCRYLIYFFPILYWGVRVCCEEWRDSLNC